MKKLFLYALLVLFVTTFSCKRDRAIRDEAAQSLQGGSSAANPTGSNGAMPAAPAAASNVPHYICPNNCAGSGGSDQAKCPVCGTDYVHNQAYHAQQPQSAPTPTPTTTLPQPAPEPAQNAAGVWHYTCAKGCAGGSGTAGTCASCGGALAHNSAYHTN